MMVSLIHQLEGLHHKSTVGFFGPYDERTHILIHGGLILPHHLHRGSPYNGAGGLLFSLWSGYAQQQYFK